MLIEELIEKAFCDGYEYAQKEFADMRRKMMEMASNNSMKLARQERKLAKTSFSGLPKKDLRKGSEQLKNIVSQPAKTKPMVAKVGPGYHMPKTEMWYSDFE